MKLTEIKEGQVYLAQVSDKTVEVKVLEIRPHAPPGNEVLAVNLSTNYLIFRSPRALKVKGD